jgi:hypothetical protein
MLSILRRRYACLAVVALLLAGCAAQKLPAQRAISDIEAVVFEAAAEAAKYAPEQLAEVRAGVRGLTAAFARADYEAVLADAPAVMRAAQNLGPAAAARKAEITRELDEQWSALAATLPDQIAALQGRIDLLSQKSSNKLAAGIDLDAARGDLSNGASLWSKAQASFATGNLTEAIAIGTTLASNLDALAAGLKMKMPAPAPAAGAAAAAAAGAGAAVGAGAPPSAPHATAVKAPTSPR